MPSDQKASDQLLMSKGPGPMPIYEAPCLNLIGTYHEDICSNGNEILVMIYNLFSLVSLEMLQNLNFK